MESKPKCTLARHENKTPKNSEKNQIGKKEKRKRIDEALCIAERKSAISVSVLLSCLASRHVQCIKLYIRVHKNVFSLYSLRLL